MASAPATKKAILGRADHAAGHARPGRVVDHRAVDRRAAGQGAPVRRPGPARPPTPPAARSRSSNTAPQLAELPELLLRRAAPGQEPVHAAAAEEGRDRRRRHDPRPGGQRDTSKLASHLDFMIRPAGQERALHRSQADPGRLEAARGHRRLPRGGRQPVLRPRRQEPDDRPVAADVQGAAHQPRALRPARADLRLWPARHQRRPHRPPDPGHDRVPLGLGPDPTVSGLECGHSLTALDRCRRRRKHGRLARHLQDQRHPDPRHTRAPARSPTSTIRRLLTLQGAMKPDEIVSLMSYKGQTNTLALPDHAEPDPDRLHAAVRRQQEAVGRGQERPAAEPVAAADQPHQPDPRAGRADRAQPVRDQAVTR